jgi:hypothetical protein
MRYFLIICILLLSGCTSNCAAPYIDVTYQYQLPPELKDHKIFLLGGGWSDRKAIWVVVSPEGIIKHPIVVEQ